MPEGSRMDKGWPGAIWALEEIYQMGWFLKRFGHYLGCGTCSSFCMISLKWLTIVLPFIHSAFCDLLRSVCAMLCSTLLIIWGILKSFLYCFAIKDEQNIFFSWLFTSLVRPCPSPSQSFCSMPREEYFWTL